MNSVINSPREIPVVADVDMLIVGGTSQAVSFALAASRNGHSVYLIAPRSYLGEDICAAYRYWPEVTGGNALARTIFSEPETPPTPMHVKLTLEQALIEAKVPFLLNCFSAGLLRSEDGAVRGAVIANRSGHQAIRSRLVVDGSLEGSVLKQAGVEHLHQFRGEQAVQFVTLCEGAGEDASEVKLLETLPGYHTEDYTVSARRYELMVDFGQGSPDELARAYSSVVEACWVPTEYRHQIALTRTVAYSSRFPTADELLIETGLLALTESIELSDGAESVFSAPIRAMVFAESLVAEMSLRSSNSEDGSLVVTCANAELVERGDVSTLRDALRPGASAERSIEFDYSRLPVLGSFDVIVAGGGTGGAPAAISAARAGARPLVVEVTSGLGGVGTMGQIARYWCGNRVGFTAEIDQGVNSLEHKADFIEDDESWSVAAKCEWYHRAGYETGCTFWLNTLCVGTVVENRRVVGLVVAGPYGYGLVHAGCVVDSTGCSDIPAAAGAPTVVVSKEHVAVQGTGLAGLKPGREYHNSDHNFSDDTDVVDVTAFFASSKLKFKGDFDCGELVDSRERRQIVGDYSITPVDILFKRRFPDTICVATSNFDSHGFTVDPVFMLVPPNKDPLWADIPFGCMLPQGLDGVLVTGLGMSAHRDALPVIRMQADVQNQGYVAGLIAAKSALAKEAVRSVDLRAVQKHLVEIGGLPERALTDVDNFPVAEAVLQEAIQNDWDQLSGISLMLHDGARSRRLISNAYASLAGERSARSLRYAQVLALLGDRAGQSELMESIRQSKWDSGWQFQGMHQFGRNMSELDSLLVCLGACGDASAWDCILEKINGLPQEAEFSHFRAIAMSCEALYPRYPNSTVAVALSNLMQRPGYRGHTHATIESAQAALSQDINENMVRNYALRELHIARALYLCGDYNQIGQSVLTDFSKDFRGHFARHARAILLSASNYKN